MGRMIMPLKNSNPLGRSVIGMFGATCQLMWQWNTQRPGRSGDHTMFMVAPTLIASVTAIRR